MRNPPAREARRWFGEAEEDLEAAGILRDAGKHHLACFHAQQAAEKALKGFLYGEGESEVTGHSVHRLRQRAERYAADLARLAEARLLDGYYIQPRYPNGVPFDTVPSEIFGEEQSARAIEIATKLLDAIRTHLPAEPPEPA